MEHLLDVIITKVYEGKKGEGEYGPWQFYNIYFDKGDRKKFSYGWSGKKPVPKEGMKVKHIEYEISTDGEYTNYNIKKMEIDETPNLEQNNKDKLDYGLISMCVSYAKDLAIAFFQANPEMAKVDDFEEWGNRIAKVGLAMVETINDKGQNSSVEAQNGTVIQRLQEKATKPLEKPKDAMKEKIACDGPHETHNGKEVSVGFCLTGCPNRDDCATAQSLMEKYPDWVK